MASGVQIANIFLKLSRPDVGDLITNLKLQKLLYYVQGLHLAIHNGEPLFEEEIEAWAYGPVIPAVYHHFKEYGSAGIDVPEDIDMGVISTEQKELIEDVNDVYGQYSALRLMEMTHNESPWLDTPKNSIISHDKLIKYFETLLVD